MLTSSVINHRYHIILVKPKNDKFELLFSDFVVFRQGTPSQRNTAGGPVMGLFDTVSDHVTNDLLQVMT